ncbi:dymeclin [Diachasmimorpha longicaudata]|uniref:dymeclin n=1 Tax=Diachasmimorpha longicaudata TaxID=58733 RepID=UPI0030B8C9AE
MGTSSSRYDDLSRNDCLERFCAKESIAPDDSFWNRFLSFNMRPPVTRTDQIELDSRLDGMCQKLLTNNLSSGNFASLIQVTLMRTSELLASVTNQNIMSAWQTYNALFAVRCILKYLVETVGEMEMIKHAETVVNRSSEELDKNSVSKLESLFEALIEIIIDVPLCEFTYVVHLEAVNCLLVLLSVQLFSQTSAEYSTVYRIVMNHEASMHAPVVVCTLLHNFAQQEHAPPGLLSREAGGSIVFNIAAGLWNVITMGMGNSLKNIQVSSSNGATEDDDRKRDTQTPLASQSLLLLLVLTNHCTTTHNPYRDALFSFNNIQDDQTIMPTKAVIPFRFNFDKLYNTICKVSNSDEVTLLLYMLLHRNPSVKGHIIKRTDIQLLVTPILQILYHAPDNTSHHIYMSLIILLILSEDDSFNKRVHEIMLKGVTWYTERCISEISLGGLLILVVIRTIQYNMLKMRDKYLHTNCLAALANMSAQFSSLHPYVSQRLLSLFETLARKHAKLEVKIQSQSHSETAVVNVNGGANANSDLIQDLTILEEVLRMLLEIINSCLTHRLAHNPNLVYTLLYKKDIFQSFRTHSAFQDIIQNIYSVINFFSYKLEQTDQSQIGVSQVLAAIKQGTMQWPKDRLRKFPELKFRYVEEEQPEEFFIPYVWSVVCQGALLYWSAKNIKLFSLNSGEQTTIVVC